MKYLILRLIEKDDEIIIQFDNLAREDVTKKEDSFSKLIEFSVKHLIEHLQDEKMIKINYMKEI